MNHSSSLTPEQSALATENQGLVYTEALKLRGPEMEFGDLVGWGQFGLIHACQSYDDSRGSKFSTYATWCIRGRILDALSEKSRAIRIPKHHQTRKGKAKYSHPSIHTATDMQISMCEVVAEEAEVEQGPEPADILTPLLLGLPERSAKVLRLRFGIGNECLTLKEVGREIGVTAERVRVIELNSLKKLRKQVGACA